MSFKIVDSSPCHWSLVVLAMRTQGASLITHSHLLVQTTNEQFLLAWAAFRVGLANESQWLQPMTHRSMVARTNNNPPTFTSAVH